MAGTRKRTIEPGASQGAYQFAAGDRSKGWQRLGGGPNANACDIRNLEPLRDTKQNPFLDYLGKLRTGRLLGVRVRPHALESWNLSVDGAIFQLLISGFA